MRVKRGRLTDAEMEISLGIWARTEADMPTTAQLRYMMMLLDTVRGADPERVWASMPCSDRKAVGSIIHELLKLEEGHSKGVTI